MDNHDQGQQAGSFKNGMSDKARQAIIDALEAAPDFRFKYLDFEAELIKKFYENKGPSAISRILMEHGIHRQPSTIQFHASRLGVKMKKGEE